MQIPKPRFGDLKKRLSHVSAKVWNEIHTKLEIWSLLTFQAKNESPPLGQK